MSKVNYIRLANEEAESDQGEGVIAIGGSGKKKRKKKKPEWECGWREWLTIGTRVSGERLRNEMGLASQTGERTANCGMT